MSSLSVPPAQDSYPSRTQSRAEIRERREPVLWGGGDKHGPLSRDQLQFFNENGYLQIDNMLTKSAALILKAEADTLRQTMRDSDDPLAFREPDSGEIRSVFMVHEASKCFAEVSRHPLLAGAARQILDDDVYIHQSRLNFKPGFEGKEFYWHSDFETWHVEDGMPEMRAVSCALPLTKNYSFNGPLMVMPGSHRQFIACVGETPKDHYKASLKKQEYGVPDHDSLTWLADRYGIEVPSVQPGSVLLFDCNTMHGSNGNISPYPRSNVFFVYNSMKNRVMPPYGGLDPRPEFIASRATIEPVRPGNGSAAAS